MGKIAADGVNRLEHARRFQDELGFSVIPVSLHSKIPSVAWKEHQTRQAADFELVRWFSKGRNNVGLVTGLISGIVAVDADSDEAEAWCQKNLPPTPVMQRTRRGLHRLYRHPGGVIPNKAKIRTSEGRISLDTRGDGGFILGPGSQHPDDPSFMYRAVGRWTPDVFARMPDFDPAWIAAPAYVAPKPGRFASTGAPSDVFRRAEAWMARRDPAIQGAGGDAWTFITACALVRDFGLSREGALVLLSRWNASCSPPWTLEALEKKVRNALCYGNGVVGVKA